MVSRIQLWSYNQIIREALEQFVEGNYELQPFANTIEDFFNIKVAEEKEHNKYNEAHGIRMVWKFITIVIPSLTDEQSSVNNIAESLKKSIRFLDEALQSKFGPTEEEEKIIETKLQSLKSETVILMIVKFYHDKSESRILYNRFKDCLSRYQRESVKYVLQDLLDPKRVLKPYAEYLKMVQDTVHKILSTASPTFIFKVAQNCCERSQKNTDGFSKLIDDVDSVAGGDTGSESGSKKVTLSKRKKKHARSNGESASSKSKPASSVRPDSLLGVSVSSSNLKRRIQMPPPPAPPKSMGSLRGKSSTSRPLSDAGNFQHPAPKKPPGCYIGRNRDGSISASSTRSFSLRQKHPFTPLQDAYIIMGMEKFGSDKREWSKMLQHYSFPEYRTAVHLKDRWRTLQKQGEVKIVRGEIKLSEKYSSLIKYLGTKNNSESHRKEKTKERQPAAKSNLINLEDSVPQTPDSEYLSPEDISDTEEKETTVVPGFENVRRWIKTGTTVTDSKPARKFTPLLITKADENKRKRHISGQGSNTPSIAEIVITASEKGECSGTGTVRRTNFDEVENDTLDYQAESQLLVVNEARKTYEYEKNSNGKYIKRPKKIADTTVTKTDPPQLHQSAENAHTTVSDKHSHRYTDTEKNPNQQVRSPSPETLEKDSVPASETGDSRDKLLLPPEETEDDIDLISAMEQDELQEQEEHSDSTMVTLQELDTVKESQDSLPSVDIRSEKQQEYSQATLGMLQSVDASKETEDSPVDILCESSRGNKKEEQDYSEPTLGMLQKLGAVKESQDSPSSVDILSEDFRKNREGPEEYSQPTLGMLQSIAVAGESQDSLPSVDIRSEKQQEYLQATLGMLQSVDASKETQDSPVDILCESSRGNKKEEQDYSEPTLGMLQKLGAVKESQDSPSSVDILSEDFRKNREGTEEYSQPTLGMLQSIAAAGESQDSQSSVDILFEDSSQKKKSPPEYSQSTLGMLQEIDVETEKRNREEETSSETVLPTENHLQSASELTDNVQSENSDDIVEETSEDFDFDDGGPLNLHLSRSSTRSTDSEILLTAEKISAEFDSDTSSGDLVIDENPSDEDNDNTLVEESTAIITDTAGQISAGEFATASESDHKENENARPRTRQAHAAVTTEIATGIVEKAINTPPAVSSGLMLNPCSPISEYYTASEGSQSERSEETPKHSDSEETNTNDETMVENTTIKDDDISNNQEQWVADHLTNPSSASAETQGDTLDLVTNMEGTSQPENSQNLVTSQGIPVFKTPQVKQEPVPDSDLAIFERIEAMKIPFAPSETESLESMKVQPNAPNSGFVPPMLFRTLKKEITSPVEPVRVVPSSETDIKDILLDKTPILKLNRVKIEPGVFTADVCAITDEEAGGSSSCSTERDVQSINDTAIEDSPVASTSATHAAPSKNVTHAGNSEGPLDLTMRRKKYVARKSTTGLLMGKMKQVKATAAIPAKKTVNGRKMGKKKNPIARGVCDMASDSSKTFVAGNRAKKRIASKNGTGTSDGSTTDAAASEKIQKKYTKKRKIVLHEEGIPVQLSKEDQLLLNVGLVSSSSKAFATFGKPRQGRRKAWSLGEDENLLNGVARYGEGNWADILNTYQFRNRTAVNLKDRYRILKEN